MKTIEIKLAQIVCEYADRCAHLETQLRMAEETVETARNHADFYLDALRLISGASYATKAQLRKMAEDAIKAREPF